jgi:alpha-glucosidase (family GH31 glycosyl hydrolase)
MIAIATRSEAGDWRAIEAPGAPIELSSPGGGAIARITADPLALVLRDASGRDLASELPGALQPDLRFRRDPPARATRWRSEASALQLELAQGAATASLSLEWIGPRSLRVRYAPAPGSRPRRICDAWKLRDGEAIYGLLERLTDSESLLSDPRLLEVAPREVGGLDLRGQRVEMFVLPTLGLYAPLHLSSQGYGLYVESSYPGHYDLGSTQRDVLRLCFELGDSEAAREFSYVLFAGSPAHVLDAYTELTGRPLAMPDWAFRHWRWRDEHAIGPPALLDGIPINAQVAEDLLEYEKLGIPPGIYLFDRPWSTGEFGFESFDWDPRRFPNAAQMLERLEARGYRIGIWSAGFAVGANLEEARRRHALAPGSDLILDFTNPAVRSWWRDRHIDFARRNRISVIKLDRGEEQIPSAASDRWADGRSGRAVHNEYPLLQAQVYREALAAARGADDSLLWVRAGWPGTQALAAAWGGDTPGSRWLGRGAGTDLGLRMALIQLVRAGFLGYAAFGTDTGGYYEFRDREVFARWLEFSAFCPIMEIGGHGAHAPWAMPAAPQRDAELIDIYKRYVQLHHDLAPELAAFARGAAQRGLPIARALVFDYPEDPEVHRLWDEYMLGESLLVAPVWRSGQRERRVYLPRGPWRDFFDPDQRFEGPRWIDVAVPLDRIPVFVREPEESGADSPPEPARE